MLDTFLNEIQKYAGEYGVKVVLALLTLIIGWRVVGLIGRMASKAIEKKGADPTVLPFVRTMIRWFLVAALLLSVASVLGLQTTSFLAVLGAAGLAIALSLQGTLSNLAGGLVLLILKPMRVGDYVELGGRGGTVEKIDLFLTQVRTPQGRPVYLPNASVISGEIKNYTDTEQVRMDLVFRIAYQDDFETAKTTLMELLQNDQRVLKTPEPLVRVLELGDNSVNIACRPWCRPADYWPLYWDLMEQAKKALESAGCSIPFPQRDVYLYQQNLSS